MPGLGAELDAIMDDLDATGAAWQAAGYPFDGPEFDAREAVFARLKKWNKKAYNVVGVIMPSEPSR